MNIRRILAYVAVVAVIVAAFWAMPRGQAPAPGGGRFAGQSGPVPVLVAAAATADVPVYLDAVGTTKALNTVTVRPQVDGQLTQVAFREGQDVQKGYVLAEIDPRTYQAQLDIALAKLAQDEAQLANARVDLDRYNKLAASNSGPKQQADTARATVAQLEAQTRSDQASIDNARTLLSYTKITAPIDGRTGIRQVDNGNIVHAADATGIVVLTQLRPISIFFNLPQQQLQQVNKAFAQGSLPVEALGPNAGGVVDRGTLTVVDNQVDQTTGTVRLKAEFPNPELQLWPGQFINVRLLVDTLKQVVVVPTAAVQRGPNGTFVYVAQADNTVVVRPVTVTQQDDTRAVVATGLQSGERVVTSGFTRLSNGAKIAVEANQPGGPAANPSTDAPPAPTTRQNDGATSDQRPGGGRRRRSEAAPGPSQ